MQFITVPQLNAVRGFRPDSVEYYVFANAVHNPGHIVVTFWMENGDYVNLAISPEGETKFLR